MSILLTKIIFLKWSPSLDLDSGFAFKPILFSCFSSAFFLQPRWTEDHSRGKQHTAKWETEGCDNIHTSTREPLICSTQRIGTYAFTTKAGITRQILFERNHNLISYFLIRWLHVSSGAWFELHASAILIAHRLCVQKVH